MNVVLRPPGVRTTCPYCGVGCGIVATPDGVGGAVIAGDPDHPANFGRLCSKGSALGETLGLEGRLLHPMLRTNDGALERAEWSRALDEVAFGFRRVLDLYGPDAIAFYLSGQLLTEDYYVANKLMKGFLGSANVETNSRLCMASAVAGQRRAFGADTVPGTYADIDCADLLVLVGSNAAWCHPVLHQRMLANKGARGARIVIIDPRRTATTGPADLHLPILPGSDTALFCGLLVHLADAGATDDEYIGAHTTGFADALVRAREIAPDVAATASATGVSVAAVATFFDLFRTTPNVVTCFSQGVNQSAQGTDKVNAIINCHLATGRIGRPGMGPLSLTGQPNAMGGREVGGLANQLAAHMGFSFAEIERVARFWRAPRIATREGLKAVAMFEAIDTGQIKALWVVATNPVASLPRAGSVAAMLRKLELFVVSENVASNDTVAMGPHVLLPAVAWGEKDGTVTNSERRISRQRRFITPPAEARPDWWIVTEVAKRMGFADAFPYASAADIFREHAALSAFENDGERDFDLSGLQTISDAEYDALSPTQWPVRTNGGINEGRFFAEGGFFTSDRRARFVAPMPPALSTRVSREFPFRLNTGRVRDLWHTMTRTGKSPRLAEHTPAPFVEIHPSDATARGLSDGGFARLRTAHGSLVVEVRLSGGQRPGSLFAPIHWTAETFSCGPLGALVAPHVDPVSGQPELKATPAAIEPATFAFRGLALARRMMIPLPSGTWWVRMAVKGGLGVMFATNEEPSAWRDHLPDLLAPHSDIAEYFDPFRGILRAAVMAGGRLECCVLLQPFAAPPRWSAIKSLFEADELTPAQRRTMLSAGTADSAMIDDSPTVCMCFGVRANAIALARSAGAHTIEAIGGALRAGTNCGSCIPELQRLLS